VALGPHPWKFTDAWMNYAESKMKAKNWASAYEQFQHIVDAKGRLENLDLPLVYLDMGLCKLARGDHQGAIDHFHQALEIDPAYSEAHLELAILFEAETHLSSAIKEYSDFVQSASADNPKVRLAKERILILEQKMNAQKPAPLVAPSPYMREQQKLKMDKIQQEQVPKDSGF
jgi:tetratricopeptide (TPR) repeat protein